MVPSVAGRRMGQPGEKRAELVCNGTHKYWPTLPNTTETRRTSAIKLRWLRPSRRWPRATMERSHRHGLGHRCLGRLRRLPSRVSRRGFL